MFKIKIIILATALLMSGVAAADLNTGLIAHWSFDDCSAKDVTGAGYDGAINGSVQCVDAINGKGLSFSDTGAVNLPALPAILANGFSGCAWASFQDNNNWGALFDFGNGAYLNNILLARTATSNQVSYFYENPPSVISAGLISNNHWQLFCATVDNKTHTAKLYVNGKMVGKNLNHQIPNMIRSSNFIGNDNWNEPFHGILDEVRIYKRALTAADITALYNQGVPVTGTIQSLALHTVTCTNNSTNQSIIIPASIATAYDCEAKGLIIKPQDDITITINGKAQ
jgi:hypothetical protein